MKSIVKIFLASYLIIFVGHAFSQVPDSLKNVNIAEGKLSFLDNSTAEVTDISFSQDLIIYKSHLGETVKKNFNEVSFIEKYKGNNGIIFALSCALGAGLGSYLGSNDFDQAGINRSTYVIAATAVGAVIGYFIGAGSKNYDVIYQKEVTPISRLNIDIVPIARFTGAALSITFKM